MLLTESTRAGLRIRIVTPQGSLARAEPPRCQSKACRRPTREGKPFCPDHVAEHAYVQVILRSLDRQEAEVARVRRVGSRAVNPTGLLAQEILRELSIHGQRTMAGLARDLGVSLSVLSAYISALSRRGELRQTRGERRQVIVHGREGGPRRSLA